MRTVRTVLAAALLAGAAAAAPALADPEPLCKLWWQEKPSVNLEEGTVDPGSKPMWVC